jgi:hypothetical protein
MCEEHFLGRYQTKKKQTMSNQKKHTKSQTNPMNQEQNKEIKIKIRMQNALHTQTASKSARVNAQLRCS